LGIVYVAGDPRFYVSLVALANQSLNCHNEEVKHFVKTTGIVLAAPRKRESNDFYKPCVMSLVIKNHEGYENS